VLVAPRATARFLGASAGGQSKKAAAAPTDIVLVKSLNGVTTLTMNNPDKLNAWTRQMLTTLREQLNRAAADSNTKVVVVTGTDPYYCAGVNLSDLIKPMHPKALHELLRTQNQAVFDMFIEYPKVGTLLLAL
jgi:enoyl-CoA hydratase/carnithine racemase